MTGPPAGLMGVADVTATKPPHPRPPPLYARKDNSEPPGTVIQRIESLDQKGGRVRGQVATGGHFP